MRQQTRTPRPERSPVGALAAGLFVLGCARVPQPCLEAGACPEGEECLANRCVPEGGTTVPSDSLRLVCELESASQSTPLLLRFSPRWRSLDRVDAAFLVLTTDGDAAPPLRIDVRSEGTLFSHGGRVPPRSEGLMARPGRARIDVTELVRAWRSSKGTHRLAVSTQDGSPLPLAWGTTGALPPRLEVYGR